MSKQNPHTIPWQEELTRLVKYGRIIPHGIRAGKSTYHYILSHYKYEQIDRAVSTYLAQYPHTNRVIHILQSTYPIKESTYHAL